MNSPACGGVNEADLVSTQRPVRPEDGKEKEESNVRKSSDRRKVRFFAVLRMGTRILVKRKAPYGAFLNHFLYVPSIPSAPSGAVISIASTATVSTMSPQPRPRLSGIDPIAACTVAFGI